MARLPPNSEMDALIFQYQHDTGRPRADEALFTLRKIGSVVKPIMRQRSWRVGTLAEFYPNQDNLLGMNTNRGQMIQLRLRYPGDPNQFLPFESIVDTMLHELCHNVIGPHNQEFRALWDQLREEHEALLRKGYTGEGFLGSGRSLGGRRMPRHEANRLARQAAEQRKVRNQGSGQRLGGSGILRGQDARAVIADAIERRLKIERGCASGTEVGERVARDEAGKGSMTTTQAGPADEDEETMMQAYIDLIQEDEREKFGGYYEPPTAANPAGPRRAQGRSASLVEQQMEIEQAIVKEKQKQRDDNRPPVPSQGLQNTSHLPSRLQQSNTSSRTVSPSPAVANKNQPSSSDVEEDSDPEEDSDTWTCEICTLINPLSFLSCDACGVERPTSISYKPQSSKQKSTKTKDNKRAKSDRELPNALKPRSSAYDSIARFNAEREQKLASKPLGWKCGGCGNFMEMEWWTCARCGRMKESS